MSDDIRNSAMRLLSELPDENLEEVYDLIVALGGPEMVVQSECDLNATPAERLPIIDCDADPFIPEGWSVVEHHKGGQVEFDSSKIVFHLEPEQRNGLIVGNELRERLKSQPVMNANVLDFLLKHPDLIPESWEYDERGRKRRIYFWGTIFCDSDGNLFIRCLYRSGSKWRWGCPWLDCCWDGQDPAAVLAS